MLACESHEERRSFGIRKCGIGTSLRSECFVEQASVGFVSSSRTHVGKKALPHRAYKVFIGLLFCLLGYLTYWQFSALLPVSDVLRVRIETAAPHWVRVSTGSFHRDTSLTSPSVFPHRAAVSRYGGYGGDLRWTGPLIWRIGGGLVRLLV